MFFGYEINQLGHLIPKDGFMILPENNISKWIQIGLLKLKDDNDYIFLGNDGEHNIKLPTVWDFKDDDDYGTIILRSFEKNSSNNKTNFNIQWLGANNQFKTSVFYKGYIFEGDYYNLMKLLLKEMPTLNDYQDVKKQLEIVSSSYFYKSLVDN